MKTTCFVLVLLTVGVTALVGCGKSGDAKPGTVPPGTVDIGSLQEAFPNPTPEVTASINKLRFSTRYRTFPQALAELDKLGKLPNLTEPQKKAVTTAIEQVKAAMQTTPAAPSP
jgi:hypothetical protein